ncbi:IS66 family insertion sequence element accessory protein TnpB [Lederbergia citrea]|uniref:IS66 family insertion sequence element accessory protein TnpB n=1 Tax=Lederbergia citrea TaxID=2833581 RepID=UPI001BC8E577|nr:IS66 family insertion sequence element accessory protein TnpB [Lederbergia citrea]MBS4203600.1 IS66 family insertion sequence element accessory protein TnpB [Lederbergia citrea]
MRQDYTSVKNIYIVCGKTDMRKGIDGLATLIQDAFELDPYSVSIFLFAGWSKDRYKCLYFDGDGFAMLYKRLDNGKLQWPKNEKEVRIFHNRSFAGYWKDYRFSKQKPFNRRRKVHFKFMFTFLPSAELVIIKGTRPNGKW